MSKLSNLNWPTIAAAALLMGAFGACKYFHIAEPGWLDTAIGLLGMSVLAYMQSAQKPPPGTP